MESLTDILNDVLIPNGFKKKDDNWIFKNDLTTKIVYLQKSRFANHFYINYGYILNSIPLDGLTMHVLKGFGSSNNEENIIMQSLLDLENDISDRERKIALIKYIDEKLLPYFQTINTEEDLLAELKKRPHLNDIPLTVKTYFGLKQ